MNKSFLITLLVYFALILSGCANDEYAIEKQYWQIKRQAERILKNPHSTPPNELVRTVNALDKFSKKFPMSNLGLSADFTIANLYMEKKDYDSGRAQLKLMAQRYKKSGEIVAQTLFLIGNSYELQDNWPSALEQYKKIMQNYTATIMGLRIPMYIARRYQAKYEPDKMIAALQEAIIHYKTSAAKYPLTPLSFNMEMLIAECYSEIKDWPNAANTLNTILISYKDKVNFEKILLSLAGIYAQKLNNPPKAIETLNVFLKEYPKSKFAASAKDMIKRLSDKTIK